VKRGYVEKGGCCGYYGQYEEFKAVKRIAEILQHM
jgi:hypothetical protein